MSAEDLQAEADLRDASARSWQNLQRVAEDAAVKKEAFDNAFATHRQTLKTVKENIARAQAANIEPPFLEMARNQWVDGIFTKDIRTKWLKISA